MSEHEVLNMLLPLVGLLLTALFGIIAFFMARLVRQLDNLATTVAGIHSTMLKIHGDLNGEVNILKAEHLNIKVKLDDMDTLWDRIRAAEGEIIKINARGHHEQN